MKYKGVIWTNHIMHRMKERKLSYDDVYWAFTKPDEIYPSKIQGGNKYYRYYNGTRLAVVAKKNEHGEWVLLTCWVKDNGFKPKQKRHRPHMSFWRYLWYMITGH